MAYLSVYMAVAWHPEQYLLADLGLVLAAFLVSFCTTVLNANQETIEIEAQRKSRQHDVCCMLWFELLQQQCVLCFIQIPLRVILGYHSIPQVLAGATLGAASAASWYLLGQMAVLAVLKSSTNSQMLLTLVVTTAVTAYLVLAFRK